MFKLDNPVALIEALAYLAWSDERIAPEERAHLEALTRVLDLDEGQVAEVRSAIETRPSLDQIAARLTDPVEIRFALAQCLILSFADGEYSSVEQRDVEALATALGIAHDELRSMETDIGRTYMTTAGTD